MKILRLKCAFKAKYIWFATKLRGGVREFTSIKKLFLVFATRIYRIFYTTLFTVFVCFPHYGLRFITVKTDTMALLRVATVGVSLSLKFMRVLYLKFSLTIIFLKSFRFS